MAASAYIFVIWLVVSLALLVVASQWLGRRIQRLAFLLTADQTAMLAIHFALLLPGTLLHELSHWAMAKLLRVRTGRLSLGPTAPKGDRVQFGGIEVERVDPFRESLIGLAPLITGTLVVLWVAQRRLGLDPHTAIQASALWPALQGAFRAADAWLWLYLAMAVSGAMLPSPSDRRAWWPLALYAGVLIAIAVAAGLVPRPSAEGLSAAQRLATTLTFAFGLTAALHLAAGIVFGLAELLFSLLLQRRVA